MTVEPAKKLTAEALPEFREWLRRDGRPIGLAVSERSLMAFADTSSSWEVSLTSRTDAAVRLVIAVCAAFGTRRRAWADDGTRTALTVARTLGVAADQVAFISCLETLRFALDPERPVPRRGGGPTTHARAIAREVGALRGGFSGEARAVALSSCRQERLWRHRQLVGWCVDLEMLNRELSAAEAAKLAAVRELGIDLTKDNAATLEWAAQRGITLRSLSRRDYEDAEVAPGAEAAWTTFKRVRSIKSRLSKLRAFNKPRTRREGRVDSRYRVHGSVTGRASSSKVALQNINSDLRPLIVPSPGMVFLGLDLSQAEVAIAAAMSGDERLKEDLRSSDVYVELVVRVFGEDARADAAKRQICKRVLLAGLLYGMGATKLAAELRISETEATTIIADLHATYPTLSAWLKATIKGSDGATWQTTAFGRPLPRTVLAENRQGVIELQPAGYRAPNWRVQGTGADLLGRAVERVATRFGTESLVLAVHDEILIEIDPKRVDVTGALADLEDAMASELNGVLIAGTAVYHGRAWKKA